jgi:DNA invertase Pin-like site-specific DNA recombinase
MATATKTARKTRARAAVYARISQDRNGTELGVRRQITDGKRICAERGWDPVTFIDNDLTAADPRVRRPQYQAMLEAVAAGDVVAVVCWDLDRLTRQPFELEEFNRLAARVGLEHLVTVADNVNPVTGDGLLVARIKAAVAAEEVAKSRKRLMRAKADKAQRGEWNGGSLPYGRGPGMVIDPAEAKVLREIARRADAGESWRSIATRLNDRGIMQRNGKPWHGSRISQRVTAPHVAGLRAHHEHLIPATWKPIVDVATWTRLRDLRADPTRRTRTGPPSRMLLTGGLTRCGRCGHACRARPTVSGTRRYGCPPERHEGRCGGVARSAEPVDAFVTAAVIDRLERSAIDLTEHDVDLAALDDELRTVDRKLAALAAAWAADALSQVEWDAARAPLNERRTELDRTLARARQSSPAAQIAGPDAGAAFAALDLEGQRAVVAELIDTVVLHPVGRNRWAPVDETTLTIRWRDLSAASPPARAAKRSRRA